MRIALKSSIGKGIQFFVFLGLFSCLSQIDFPVDIKGGVLVVTGRISTIADQNIIELGRTAETERLPEPLSGASIEVFDEFGRVAVYSEIETGVYEAHNVIGTVGRTYHIEIKLPNGSFYKSKPERMPAASGLDLIQYEVVEEKVVDFEGIPTSKMFYKIYANSTLDSRNTYLKWRVTEAFLLSPTDFPDPFGSIPPPCFIVQNADPQRIVSIDAGKLATTQLKRQLIASREIDWSFLEKHYFSTYQSSITKDAFEYWRKVDILANQVGSIFDSPPAEISGNLICVSDPLEKVLGFFQACNETFIRKDFYPSDLPFDLRPLVSKCDFTGNTDPLSYKSRCINCIDVRNSSYQRPSWF